MTITIKKIATLCFKNKDLPIVRFGGSSCLPKQKGAVLAEFVVIISLVLVPLFIGLTFIAKYTDNAQKIEVAARYSAWERTVWYQKIPESLKKADSKIKTEKSAEEIAFELENRVFANRNSAIYLAQQTDKVNETDDPMSESFWLDNSGKAISLYKKNNKMVIQVADGKQAKMYGYSSGLLGKFFGAIGGLTGFDIDMGGAMTTTVNQTLVQPEFLKEYITSDMTISRSQTILADGWNAAGPAHAKRRAQGLVGTSLLDFGVFNDVRDIIAWLPMAREIKSDSLIFGHVVVDAVPESRLKKYKK